MVTLLQILAHGPDSRPFLVLTPQETTRPQLVQLVEALEDRLEDRLAEALEDRLVEALEVLLAVRLVEALEDQLAVQLVEALEVRQVVRLVEAQAEQAVLFAFARLVIAATPAEALVDRLEDRLVETPAEALEVQQVDRLAEAPVAERLPPRMFLQPEPKRLSDISPIGPSIDLEPANSSAPTSTLLTTLISSTPLERSTRASNFNLTSGMTSHTTEPRPEASIKWSTLTRPPTPRSKPCSPSEDGLSTRILRLTTSSQTLSPLQRIAPNSFAI